MYLDENETKTVVKVVAGIIILMLLIIMSVATFATVSADRYQVKQAFMSGTMSAKMTPGVWWQGFGNIYDFPNAETFYMVADAEEGTSEDQSIHVRFNDGSDSNVSATARILLPKDPQQAIDLVEKYSFKSWNELEDEFIRPNIRKIMTITATLMNATESYQSRRDDFIFYMQDQFANGLYMTENKEVDYIDPLTQIVSKRRVSVIRLGEDGLPIRAELITDPNTGTQMTPWATMGITFTQFDLKNLLYSDTVYAQIAAQQEARMGVETAIANALKAEQDLLTAQKQGEAAVMTARYTEEAQRVLSLVDAEYAQQVAEIEMQAAEFTKQRDILLGEGEAEKRRLILDA
ncbi:MAG: hypothetical protein US98_C0005G0010, partial [Parcubacteria group bacterium GW2011_GWC1_38_6]